MGRKVLAQSHRGRRLAWKFVIASLAFGMVVGAPLIAQMYDTVTIKKGDTLWDLSVVYLQGGWKYAEWLPINTMRSGGNPDLIYPGEVFNIPGTMKEMEPPGPPEEIELPIAALEQMLSDMSARLSGVAGELETIKTQLRQMDGRLGSLEEQADAQSRTAMPPLDLSSIEARVDTLDQSVGEMIASGADELGATLAATNQEVSSVRAELETLSGSVEAQAAIQKKALDEFTTKLAMMQQEQDRTPEVDSKKRAVGLVSFLTAGLALLVVTASR